MRDVPVDVRRLGLRSAKYYCGVLLDDNSRRTVCRLLLRTKTLRLILLDESKSEERIRLEDLDDLFNHADRIRADIARIEDTIKQA